MMELQFNAVTRAIDKDSALISIGTVAGIDAVQIQESTRIINPDGANTSWAAIRPGMRILVSGLDEGGTSLKAQELFITGARVELDKESHHHHVTGAAKQVDPRRSALFRLVGAVR